MMLMPLVMMVLMPVLFVAVAVRLMLFVMVMMIFVYHSVSQFSAAKIHDPGCNRVAKRR